MKFDKRNKMLEKKGFYMVLCVCLLGVAVLCWSTVNVNENEPEESTPSRVVEESTQDVAEVVSNIPKDTNASSKEESFTVSSEEQSVQESSVAQSPFFVMPVGGTISKSFNAKTPQYSETYKDWRLHLGIDIKASKGTAIMSSGFGKVTKVYKDTMWGNVVEIDHGNDMTGIYCGLNGKPIVKEGDEVEPGQQLGTIDIIPCESVDEPHLHFAMKNKDQWVDPMQYIG